MCTTVGDKIKFCSTVLPKTVVFFTFMWLSCNCHVIVCCTGHVCCCRMVSVLISTFLNTQTIHCRCFSSSPSLSLFLLAPQFVAVSPRLPACCCFSSSPSLSLFLLVPQFVAVSPRLPVCCCFSSSPSLLLFLLVSQFVDVSPRPPVCRCFSSSQQLVSVLPPHPQFVVLFLLVPPVFTFLLSPICRVFPRPPVCRWFLPRPPSLCHCFLLAPILSLIILVSQFVAVFSSSPVLSLFSPRPPVVGRCFSARPPVCPVCSSSPSMSLVLLVPPVWSLFLSRPPVCRVSPRPPPVCHCFSASPPILSLILLVSTPVVVAVFLLVPGAPSFVAVSRPPVLSSVSPRLPICRCFSSSLLFLLVHQFVAVSPSPPVCR